MKKTKPARSKKKSATVPLIVFGVVAALAVLGGAVFLLKDRLGSIASIMDSPKSILNDALALAVDMRETIDSIEDVSSRDAAIAELGLIEERSDRLAIRAAAFGPLTEDEFKELNSWFEDKIPDELKKFKTLSESRQRDSSLFSKDLSDALVQVQFSFGRFGSVLQRGWSPIPEPDSERERLEHQILMIQRRAWAANVTATDSNEQRAVATIDAATEELRGLLQENKEMIESESLFAPGSPYFNKTFRLSSGFLFEGSNLPETKKAAERFTEVANSISTARMEAQARRQEEATARARENMMARMNEQRERAREESGQSSGSQTGRNQGAPGGSRMSGAPGGSRMSGAPGGSRMSGAPAGGRPTIPGGRSSGPPVSLDPSLPPEQAMMQRIAAFKERNSAEQTVVVKVVPKSDDLGMVRIRVALQRALRLRQHFFGQFGDEYLLLFAHEGPISEVVEKLNVGKVLSANESTRSIVFEIDRTTP